MYFSDTVRINASRQVVWDFLTNPEQVVHCAPGVETIEIISPNEAFKVIASVGIGSVRTRFSVDVEWLMLQEPEHAKMKAHGIAPGSAVDVITSMTLILADGNSTELSWTADVKVMGTIASLASRMMGSVTKKLTNEFFEAVKDKIEG